MTLRRLNLNDEAAKALEPITEGMDVIENTSYYNLVLMYKGVLSRTTIGGSEGRFRVAQRAGNVGLENLYNGRREPALKIFRKIVSSAQWTSFGFIAAEADLKKL